MSRWDGISHARRSGRGRRIGIVTTPALIQNSSVHEEVMRIIWVSRPFSTHQEAIVVCQILDDVLLAFYDLFTPFPDAGVEIYYMDPADYTNTVQIL